MKSIKAYNWNELPKDSPRHGIERVGFRTDNAMVVVNWIKPGITPRPHSHDFDQLTITVQGEMRLHLGDEVIECTALVRVPSGVVHWAKSLGKDVCINLDVFSPIREDYLHLVNYQTEYQ